MKEQAVRLRRNVRLSGKGWTRKNVPFETVRGRGWEQRIDTALNAYGPDAVALGAYYVCWSERLPDGSFKSCYEPAGYKYAEAKTKLEGKKNWLGVERTTQNAGVPTPQEPGTTESLDTRMKNYLKEREEKQTLSEGSVQAFRIAFDEFVLTTKVATIEQVTAATLDRFVAGMRKRGRHDTTTAGYFAHVATFLRSQNLFDLLRQYPAPKPAKKTPESYEEADLDALLNFCYSKPRHITRPNYFEMGLVAELLYKTGLRKKELSHLTWDMVDRNTEFFRVKDDQRFTLTMRGGREKKVRFRTKTREDRAIDIPIAEDLQDRMRQWRKMHSRNRFVFPTKYDNPDMDLLDKLRTVILHAGLNCKKCDACRNPCGYCGQCRCQTCKGCRSKHHAKCIRPTHGKNPCTGIQCKAWTLHKMRHSFITKAVGDGVDLKTLMDITGQKRLTTVEKYLSVVKKRKAQEAINRVFANRIDYAALPAASN